MRFWRKLLSGVKDPAPDVRRLKARRYEEEIAFAAIGLYRKFMHSKKV